MCKRKEIENLFKPRIHNEEGRYWAEIPAMPGCFTVADTLDELRGNLIEAAQCWLLTSADMENYRKNDRRRITATRHCHKERLLRYSTKRESQSRNGSALWPRYCVTVLCQRGLTLYEKFSAPNSCACRGCGEGRHD